RQSTQTPARRRSGRTTRSRSDALGDQKVRQARRQCEARSYTYLVSKHTLRSTKSMVDRFSDIAIQRELGSLPGWSRRADVITKTFQFRNFLTGIDFVVAIAKVAEAADHHPDIDIRYTKVVCTLSTHSAGGITQKDLDMARQIDGVQEKIG